eukprot:jgi/Ulvmu1/9960/UM059_0008.1
MRANNYDIASTVPPDNPSRRVDVVDFDEVVAKVKAGQKVALCRCYKSKKFPYCDGSHIAHNEETGDNIAPAVVTDGIPDEKRGLEFQAEISEEEKNKPVKGPRANNYGVKSNVPPDNPSKCVHMLDVEDLESAVDKKGVVALCRCFASGKFPLCNGAHNKHNEEHGDNAGPLVLKRLGGGAEPAPQPSKEDDLKGLKVIPLSEVAKHNKDGDAWTVVHRKVLDISEFIPRHPGGKAVLKQYAGKIADEGFDGVHQENVIMENLKPEHVLGKISDEEAQGASDDVDFKPPPIDSILNLYDMEQVAHASMKDTSWGYYFTGSMDEYTKCGNQEIYRRLRLIPRVMRNVADVNMETSMLGEKMSFPVYISAAAKGGLAHSEAEEALCRAAFEKQTIQMCPHMATKTLEQMAAARAKGQIQFLQLYVEKDRAASKATVEKANELGFSGLFLTVDSAGIGKRETDLRLTPGGSAPRSKATKRRWADDLTWDDIPWFRSLTDMPLVLKGVQSGADAVLAYQHGLNGIVVSNHGGRNMDTARPALEALIEIMASLRDASYDPKKFEVYIDGGIKRGSDVFKALAIGATAVGIGRAALFGLAGYGQEGVEKTLEILQDELFTTMQMCGAASLKDIVPEMVQGTQQVAQWTWATSRDHLPPFKMGQDHT